VTKKGTLQIGNWKNDKLEGQARVIYDKGECYQGGFSNHKKDGRGVNFDKDGNKSEKIWKKGVSVDK
jgi:hypothetical protein